MEKAQAEKLKRFIDNNIPWRELNKMGFFKKPVAISIYRRKPDYEGIAARICYFFSLKSIYEYGKVCNGKSCDGKCKDPIEACKSYKEERAPLHWKKLKLTEVDKAEIFTQDHWLN